MRNIHNQIGRGSAVCGYHCSSMDITKMLDTKVSRELWTYYMTGSDGWNGHADTEGY